ncbi:MAG TPA: signal peptidase I [Glycomyces sp.]|nr:signal peptidase I [Glycomyces sp.]
MSPGSPDDSGAKGPRRIDWSRLPGPGNGSDKPLFPRGRPRRRGPAAPGTSAEDLPRRGRPSAGSAPQRGAEPASAPRSGAAPSRRMPPPRVGDGRTGSHPQVTGAYNRVTGTHEQVEPGRDRRSEKRRAGKDGEPESRLSQPHKRHYLSLWVELPLLLVVAFSAAVLLRTFAVQPFYIPSGSMEQTLQEGDKVLVLKLTTTLRTPQRGEVVVFRGTDEWDPEYRPKGGGTLLSDFGTAVLDLVGLAEPDEKDFIKRVIAVGGDTVSCCDAEGNVQVNGISLHEGEYVYDDAPLDVEPGNCHSRRFEPVTIPEGHVWVMGDHRGNSQDSRCQGPVPVENIIGRAIALVWPTDRARNLEIPSSFDVLEGTTGEGPEAPAEGDSAEGRASGTAAGHPAGAGTHERLPPATAPPPAPRAVSRRGPPGATGPRQPDRTAQHGRPELSARPRRLAP